MSVVEVCDRFSHIIVNGVRYGPYIDVNDVVDQLRDVVEGKILEPRMFEKLFRSIIERKGLNVLRLPDGSYAVLSDVYEIARVRHNGGEIVFEGGVTGLYGVYPPVKSTVKVISKLIDFETGKGLGQGI